jgi:hypothetical protein
MIERIVSGGQTGVDRGALDAALELGVPCGGWCPKGRRAEDGRLESRYPLRETSSPRYPQRTEWNVRDSDGTLVLARGALRAGSALTVELARRRAKPWLVVDLTREGGGQAVPDVVAWIHRHAVKVLNVAGPRESENPGIHAQAIAFVRDLVLLDRGGLLPSSPT